jgi:GcrA cell cycle regulator
MMSIGWNDERVETLKKLWGEGLSASQIATRLGGVTRNAVIGKVHRLGLSGRATTSRMKSHRPRARSAASAAKRVAKSRFATIGNPALRALYQPDAAPLPVVEELVIPLAERKTIQTLVECSCRWPIGDPQHADFHFCGKTKVAGLPYCEFHARRAFQPPQVRRRERDLAVAVMTAAAVAQPAPSASETTQPAGEPVEV